MPGKMSFWGVGPKYTFFSAIYCTFVIALSRYFNPFFKISFVSYGILKSIGVFLILIGIPFYFISLVSIKRAFKEGVLVTDGAFGMCRHPVYSAWIVFFIPGIMLLINTWAGLSAPFVMYFLVVLFVREEEVYLEGVFGQAYLEYKKRIPIVLPIGWLKSKVRQLFAQDI
jgi:protein-S-isoprenylcysteine O-methyltransferase Ste14